MMLPRMRFRNRLRLALAVLFENVWLVETGSPGYGQSILLRTVDDVKVVDE